MGFAAAVLVKQNGHGRMVTKTCRDKLLLEQNLVVCVTLLSAANPPVNSGP